MITNERTVPVRLKRGELLKVMLLLDENYSNSYFKQIRDKLREQLDAWEVKEQENEERVKYE